ncbi:MAG: DUF294 nucleotidyltransferase-like domain-containing protein, partial [Gammaproteobacteria bacterium]
MDVELIEVRDFITATPPFDRLPVEALESLPRQLTVRYLRRGSEFPPATQTSPALWLLRTGAVEFRNSQRELVEKLGEGELFADHCLDSPVLPYHHGKVVEDSLFYLLPCNVLNKLRELHTEFDRHFEQDLRARLQHAVVHLQQQHGNNNRLMQLEIGSLIKRKPISISSLQTIQQAAQCMSKEDISSLLLVDEGKLTGIVTDRDLRQRVIAAGVDMESQVKDIMTSDLHTLRSSASVFDALILMTRQHIHHIPVVDSLDRLKGIITSSDILHQVNLNTMALANTISNSKDVDDIVEACRQLPELQAQLINSGMSANQLTQALTAVTDEISKQLLQLAEQQLGKPPVPYAWMMCGSQARREQTTVTDQDNALLLDDDYRDEHQEYFSRLARFVSDGLARCGFVYCPGDVMATNVNWRQPRKVWRNYFDKWINTPEPQALMHASIFFDMRTLYGDQSLFTDLHREVLQLCRDNTIFLTYMAANALQYRPPLGFFRRFVLIHNEEHEDTLDIKHRGLIPIVDMVRVYAL